MRRLTPVQHMKMAALMYGRAQATGDPERRQRRIMLANAHLDLALKATVQEEQAGYRLYRPVEDVQHPGDNGVVLGRTAGGVRLAWQAVAREASERIEAKTKPAELTPPDADDALDQRLLPFFKAGMADFANDVIEIRELISGADPVSQQGRDVARRYPQYEALRGPVRRRRAVQQRKPRWRAVANPCW